MNLSEIEANWKNFWLGQGLPILGLCSRTSLVESGRALLFGPDQTLVLEVGQMLDRLAAGQPEARKDVTQ